MANFYNSKRLQRVGRLLLSKRWYNTQQINIRARVLAVNSCVDELRDNGWKIECRSRYINGYRVYEYQAQKVPARHREWLK